MALAGSISGAGVGPVCPGVHRPSHCSIGKQLTLKLAVASAYTELTAPIERVKIAKSFDIDASPGRLL
jgi:hypothetical protein